MDTLSIGKVAKETGLGVETVRYYEREGLIAEPPRRESGYRKYPPEVVSRLLFIRRAKELGFTLREIRELLSLRVAEGKTCLDVKKFAEVKITEVDEKIGHLREIRDALQKLSQSCVGDGPTSECPILEVLDKEKSDEKS